MIDRTLAIHPAASSIVSAIKHNAVAASAVAYARYEAKPVGGIPGAIGGLRNTLSSSWERLLSSSSGILEKSPMLHFWR